MRAAGGIARVASALDVMVDDPDLGVVAVSGGVQQSAGKGTDEIVEGEEVAARRSSTALHSSSSTARVAAASSPSRLVTESRDISTAG